MGKSSGHLIFLSLSNIPNSHRNKPEAKALIGYLPIIKAKNSISRYSDSLRKLQREIFHKCLEILLTSIANKPELNFVVHDNIVTFVLRISIIIADMLEANMIANIYHPSKSKRPCGLCLVYKDNLNNTNQLDIMPRTLYNVQ